MSDNLGERVASLEAHRQNDLAQIGELSSDMKKVLARINWLFGGGTLLGFILTMAVNVAMKVWK